MTADAAKPARRWWKYLLALFAVVFLCVACLLFYTTTGSFQSLVRRRLVAEVERITGGRAQVGSLHTIPFRLQFEVRDITVHGGESVTALQRKVKGAMIYPAVVSSATLITLFIMVFIIKIQSYLFKFACGIAFPYSCPVGY